MKNRILALFLAAFCLLLAGCEQEVFSAVGLSVPALQDGTYSADFSTDGSMFHVNEAHHGKGLLTVTDGQMTIHVTLPSKNTVNLYPGTAEEAQAEGAVLLQPTTDAVTYDDGMTEKVYGFDIPVPYLDREFACALVGKKGKWYDHQVMVSNPAPCLPEGEYTAEVTLTGGSGRASVESPALIISKNFGLWAEIVWSSPNYEYMLVDGKQYDRLDTAGNSVMRIPVMLDSDLAVSALTTAMSEPHLIDYTLHFDGSSLQAK